MEHTDVIIKPLVTEKSTHQSLTKNAYAFQVHSDASKDQIKAAIESLYEVKVSMVRTMVRKGKPRRTKTQYVNKSDVKRAIVTLNEGSKIELF